MDGQAYRTNVRAKNDEHNTEYTVNRSITVRDFAKDLVVLYQPAKTF